MPKYTTQEQVENVLQRSLSDNELQVVDDAIEAVGSSINAYTGRRWFDLGDTTASEETRFYDGNGNRELFIDDFTSISELKILDSMGNTIDTLGSTHYETRPRNADWKNSILLKDRRFPHIKSAVEITGVFYSGEAPIEVQLAAATLVGHFFSSSRNVGDFRRESIEGYSYEILTGEEKTNQELAVLNRIDHWRKVDL